METAFGASFAGVRVHTGGSAAEVTSAHAAEALTVGGDVAFAPGSYRPGTPGGDHLIAHELAHVVQQSGGTAGVQASAIVSSPGEPAEAAADRAADTVLAGGRVSMPTGLTTRRRIMRRARLGSPTLPAVSFSAPVPGLAGRNATPVAEARPGPVESSMVSPAGGRMTAVVGHAATPAARGPGEAARANPPQPKSPDEAQTPIAGAEPAPPSVAVAGSSAGASGETVPAGDAATKEQEKAGALKDKKEKIDKNAKEEGKRQEEQTAEAEAGVEEGRARTVRFGQNLGDRGAGAAARVAQRVVARAGGMRVHEPAQQRIDDAQAAAEPPANEGSSRAQGTQVATVAEAQPPPPNASAAGQQILDAVEQAAPDDMEEMGDMESSAGSISSVVQSAVGTQVSAVTDTLGVVKEEPAPEPTEPAVPQPEPMAAAETAAPNMAAATPPAVPEEALDASEFKEAADAELAPHEIDDETLQKANEGPLAGVAADKQNLDTSVENAADNVRGAEAPALAETAGGLSGSEASGDSQMTGTRETGQTSVAAEQDATRTGAETNRGGVAGEIETLAREATEKVTTNLDGLRERVTTGFDKRQQEHLASFNTDTRAELEEYKDDRYSGWTGWAKWLKDKVVSINELPAVQRIYQRNRDLYMSRIDTLVKEITSDIETTITESKRVLAEARTKIQEKVDALPKSLKAEAEAAQKRAEQGFKQMERQIEQTSKQMTRELNTRREQAVKAVDDALKQIQAENASLVDKIKNAIKALAEMLGRFLVLMAKITRMGIGTFIGEAASQALSGIRNNLWDELKLAFNEWIESKFAFIQMLLNIPPNVIEMLTQLATTFFSTFIDNLPEMMPAIAVAAMAWLATQLALKLIPGAGAIMAVIDGIRAAWGFVQNFLAAASAFYDFVVIVASRGNGAVQFAKALARGIIAALEALLTFLGVDALIRRVAGAILKPIGKIFSRLGERFKKMISGRRKGAEHHAPDHHKHGRGPQHEQPGDQHQHKSAAKKAEHDEHMENRRHHDDQKRRQEHELHSDKKKHGDRDPNAKRQREHEKERDKEKDKEKKDQERLEKAIAAISPSLGAMLERGALRPRIRVQLLYWRARWRLRKLSLTENGVVIGNSPDRQLLSFLQQNSDGVFRMIMDIAKARWRRAQKTTDTKRARYESQHEKEVEEARAKHKKQPEPRPPISHQPGEHFETLGTDIASRTEEETPSKGKNVILQVGTGRPVFAQQGAQTANIIIRGLGTYPKIVEKLKKRQLDKNLIAEIQKIRLTGEGDIDAKRSIALLFGAEPARAQSAYATSALSLVALERQKSNLPEMFGTEDSDRPGGGGIYPASPFGAAKEAREKSDDHIHRIVMLVHRTVKGMEFNNTSGLKAKIVELLDMFDRAVPLGD
jgi:hypothetical protein